MSLLDKLIEKKDLDSYLRLRIRRLKQEATERIGRYPEKDRATVVKMLDARIKELSKLGDAMRANTIKEKCKRMWRHFNYPPKKSLPTPMRLSPEVKLVPVEDAPEIVEVKEKEVIKDGKEINRPREASPRSEPSSVEDNQIREATQAGDSGVGVRKIQKG